MIRHLSRLALCVLVASCSKKEAPPAPGDAMAASPAPAATSTPPATSAASEAGSPAKRASASYAGKYTVAPATMYIPSSKDWSSTKFKNDESKMLGDGELSLAIDGDGMVTGTTDGGPLGASVLSGKTEGDTLTATIRRKDVKDDGLTGTLLAALAGEKLEGTMKLADGQTLAVRAATFTLTKR